MVESVISLSNVSDFYFPPNIVGHQGHQKLLAPCEFFTFCSCMSTKTIHEEFGKNYSSSKMRKTSSYSEWLSTIQILRHFPHFFNKKKSFSARKQHLLCLRKTILGDGGDSPTDISLYTMLNCYKKLIMCCFG